MELVWLIFSWVQSVNCWDATLWPLVSSKLFLRGGLCKKKSFHQMLLEVCVESADEALAAVKVIDTQLYNVITDQNCRKARKGSNYVSDLAKRWAVAVFARNNSNDWCVQALFADATLTLCPSKGQRSSSRDGTANAENKANLWPHVACCWFPSQVRPRKGNFIYNRQEIEQMRKEILAIKETKAKVPPPLKLLCVTVLVGRCFWSP